VRAKKTGRYGLPRSSLFEPVYAGKTGLNIDLCTRLPLCFSTESKILSIRGHTELSVEERELLYMAKHLGEYQNFQKRSHVASW
jgi:hypothetical protein